MLRLPWSRRTQIPAGALVLLAALAVRSPADAAPAQPPPPQVEVTGATLVEFDDATGVWNLHGNPVVVTRGPVIVRADVMHYDTAQQLLSATSGVLYRDSLVEATAGTVAVWVVTQQAIAEGDVNVVYHGPDQVQLAAARVELFAQPGRATASGKAVLTHPRGTLTAAQITYDHPASHAVANGGTVAETADGTLRADRIEAFLPRQELVAQGEVTFTRSDLEGHAPRAVLHQQAGTVELSGGAMVRLGANVFGASVITVELATRRVTAAGGVHVVAQP